MNFTLRISGKHHAELRRHLFPGDGKEAIAFALCGSHRSESLEVFTVHRVSSVPYELCVRASDRLTWPTEFLAPILDEAGRKKLRILKIHSHPTFYANFSSADDASDRETFSAVANWLDADDAHVSAVMLPDGQVFGRAICPHVWQSLSRITVAGDDLRYWTMQAEAPAAEPCFERQEQLFGLGTTNRLRGLRIGVVGCSGTGSVVIELLARLGVGALVLVDHDLLEDRNVNRIVNSKRSDEGRPKVEVLANAIREMGLGTEVMPLPLNLFSPEAVRAIAGCDMVFGCMDKAEGRHLLNKLATFYLVPYIDLGVHLAADGQGGIDEASAVVHYLQPGGSSLLSRRAFTMARVRAENLQRTDPAAYADQRKAGYIEGVEESSPAVISVNASAASFAVNEFLARLHPFRSCAPNESAVTRINMMEVLIFKEDEGESCSLLSRHIGRGDVDPLLDLPALSTSS